MKKRIFPVREKQRESKSGENTLAHVEVLSTFLSFPSLPHSNKFTQRRGTAPIEPGKEEQEEGDEREGPGGGGSEEEEEERLKGRREGLKDGSRLDCLSACPEGKSYSWAGSSPAPPYGPAGP